MQRKVTKLLLFHKRLTYSFEVGCVASFVSEGTAYKFVHAIYWENKFQCNDKLNLIRYKKIIQNDYWMIVIWVMVIYTKLKVAKTV